MRARASAPAAGEGRPINDHGTANDVEAGQGRDEAIDARSYTRGAARISSDESNTRKHLIVGTSIVKTFLRSLFLRYQLNT